MGIFRAYDIRGVYGKDLTEEIMARIGEAAGTYCPGTFTAIPFLTLWVTVQ